MAKAVYPNPAFLKFEIETAVFAKISTRTTFRLTFVGKSHRFHSLQPGLSVLPT